MRAGPLGVRLLRNWGALSWVSPGLASQSPNTRRTRDTGSVPAHGVSHQSLSLVCPARLTFCHHSLVYIWMLVKDTVGVNTR